ncbi:MAG: hypothetical protein M3436_10165 [Pseudomonadota bacterium]|nr:hypothetical protein [Pseudomonadota bacterium]
MSSRAGREQVRQSYRIDGVKLLTMLMRPQKSTPTQPIMAPARISWALKRVFDIDIEHCPHCGGTLKIIAAIEDPHVICQDLTPLSLPIRAPPRSPARLFDRLRMA